jgi:alpha-D-ribose 1-methylphosphonate 5-triphosphate synthase subunit PhnG
MVKQQYNIDRQMWMATLARAEFADVQALVAASGGVPAHTVLKSAETGTVMVEARAGGTGARFNLTEATVTRCIIRLASGTMGVSYALGRDKRKALLCAYLDAAIQDEGSSSSLRRAVHMMAQAQAHARDRASRKAATTKVEFFTLVRGE